MSISHDALAGLRVGRFEILERIGSGAVGAVYRARDTWDGALVAVKILSKEFAAKATAVKRFEREAAVVRKLKHPHIVSAIELGRDGELVYLAMELIPGESLEARLLRDKALPPDLVAEIGRQIADALAAAHSAGIIHRDLKPANVMLVGDSRVKIVDFGVASGYEGELGQPLTRLTQEGFTVGTPAYMAPEQFSSAEVGPEADLYSLGLILHEMLSGMPAFNGSLREIIVEQMTVLPPILPAYGGLGDLVQRLAVKTPSARPSDAAQIRQELQEISEGLQKTHLTPEVGPSDPAISGISLITTDRALAPGPGDRTQPMQVPNTAPMDITMPMQSPPPWFPGSPPKVEAPHPEPVPDFTDESLAELVRPVDAEDPSPSKSSFDALRARLNRPMASQEVQRRLIGAAVIVFLGALSAALGSLWVQRSRAIVVKPALVEIAPITAPPTSAPPHGAAPTQGTHTSTSKAPWSMELEP